MRASLILPPNALPSTINCTSGNTIDTSINAGERKNLRNSRSTIAHIRFISDQTLSFRSFSLVSGNGFTTCRNSHYGCLVSGHDFSRADRAFILKLQRDLARGSCSNKGVRRLKPAKLLERPLSARLKSCPDTKPSVELSSSLQNRVRVYNVHTPFNVHGRIPGRSGIMKL